MNPNVNNGPWQRFKIQLRKTWSELTDEDLEAIARNRDSLIHVVQKRYVSERVEFAKSPRLLRQDFRPNQYLPAYDGLRIRSRN